MFLFALLWENGLFFVLIVGLCYKFRSFFFPLFTKASFVEVSTSSERYREAPRLEVSCSFALSVSWNYYMIGTGVLCGLGLALRASRALLLAS